MAKQVIDNRPMILSDDSVAIQRTPGDSKDNAKKYLAEILLDPERASTIIDGLNGALTAQQAVGKHELGWANNPNMANYWGFRYGAGFTSTRIGSKNHILADSRVTIKPHSDKKNRAGERIETESFHGNLMIAVRAQIDAATHQQLVQQGKLPPEPYIKDGFYTVGAVESQQRNANSYSTGQVDLAGTTIVVVDGKKTPVKNYNLVADRMGLPRDTTISAQMGDPTKYSNALGIGYEYFVKRGEGNTGDNRLGVQHREDLIPAPAAGAAPAPAGVPAAATPVGGKEFDAQGIPQVNLRNPIGQWLKEKGLSPEQIDTIDKGANAFATQVTAGTPRLNTTDNAAMIAFNDVGGKQFMIKFSDKPGLGTGLCTIMVREKILDNQFRFNDAAQFTRTPDEVTQPTNLRDASGNIPDVVKAKIYTAMGLPTDEAAAAKIKRPTVLEGKHDGEVVIAPRAKIVPPTP